MKLNVNKDILKLATECARGQICQQGGGKPCCEISDTVNGTVFFTDKRHPMGCDYQCGFGSKHLCVCPVRQEIHKQHRL